MATWPEARHAKLTRQREEARLFKPHEFTTRRCPGCGQKMIKVVCDYDGSNTHPTCDPGSQALLEADRKRRKRGTEEE